LLTYRLSGVNQSGTISSREITVTTLPETPDPLKVTLEFDTAPPLIDMSNFDPNNFDPNQFDPNNFDASQFMPQPIQTQAVIGTAGGEISVTGSNGVTYTLTIPPGALDYDTTITLKPVSSIPDLPLSGGLTAAVFIEPATLVFKDPATLKMTLPADFPEPTAPLALAFAFEEDGQEFHLYPFDTAGGVSGHAPHVASLFPAWHTFGLLADIARLQFAGGYGQGRGTTEDVRNISRKPPAKSVNRAEQRRAVSQINDDVELAPLPSLEDELAPLPSPEAIMFGEYGQKIRKSAESANDLRSLQDALEEFDFYMRNGGGKYNPGLNDKILDALVQKAKKLLEKNKGECLTSDDFFAQELVLRLTNPVSDSSKALAERFQAKYGKQLLVDLANGRKACVFELSLKSSLTFEAEGSILFTEARAPKIKLFLTYAKGQMYLHGSGQLTPKMRIEGDGCSFPLRHYDQLTFNVEAMYPVFQGNQLKDFILEDYSISGWTKQIGVTGMSNEKCITLIQLTGGGDAWTASFTSARATFGELRIANWKITSPSKGAITAHWESVVPSFVPLGISGTLMSEDTKFDLRITPSKK
jgi:hypothetical protein